MFFALMESQIPYVSIGAHSATEMGEDRSVKVSNAWPSVRRDSVSDNCLIVMTLMLGFICFKFRDFTEPMGEKDQLHKQGYGAGSPQVSEAGWLSPSAPWPQLCL